MICKSLTNLGCARLAVPASDSYGPNQVLDVICAVNLVLQCVNVDVHVDVSLCQQISKRVLVMAIFCQ